MYGALQAGPEVLNTVAVDVPVYVLFQVVHDFMVVQEVHAPLFAVLIGIDVRPGVNVLFDNRLNGGFGAILYHGSPNGLAALQDAQHHGFSASVAAFGLRARLAVLVHVSRLTAHEGFINFDFAADLAAVVLILHCGPNPMVQEPRGFLGDADGPPDFATTDSVLGVHNLPHGH